VCKVLYIPSSFYRSRLVVHVYEFVFQESQTDYRIARF
jgi:hypothetical protein